jgi:glycosyltransferase involved in cell wall biosynthesis
MQMHSREMNSDGHVGKSIRVSLFYDVDDWAFHNVALNLQRVGHEPYTFRLIPRHEWFGKPRTMGRILGASDLAVFLWRFDLIAFLDSLGEGGWHKLTGRHRCALIALVYDHVYADERDMQMHGDPFIVADGVATSSARLRNLYRQAEHLPDITHCVPDGVDLARFYPDGADMPVKDRPLRIGWVGDSAWGITLGEDFKGKRAIFEPALHILRARGLPFEVRVADKAEYRIPSTEMPAFYGDLDVLVCSSLFEGTPNPVLEAMASGCAVVSTDVGIVSEVFGPEQMLFLLPERSAEALANALARLIREPATLAALKHENVSRRETLSWETRWPAWAALFEEALSNALAGRGATDALATFRNRHMSSAARLRRIVATNRVAYRAYVFILGRWPGLIRWSKRKLSGVVR